MPSEDSDQTVNVHADLNLCRVHMSEGSFYDIVAKNKLAV